jgi:hypothetical protein
MKRTQKGRQEGILVRHFEEKLEVAKRSLAARAEPVFVAEITGLPLKKNLELEA